MLLAWLGLWTVAEAAETWSVEAIEKAESLVELEITSIRPGAKTAWVRRTMAGEPVEPTVTLAGFYLREEGTNAFIKPKAHLVCLLREREDRQVLLAAPDEGCLRYTPDGKLRARVGHHGHEVVLDAAVVEEVTIAMFELRHEREIEAEISEGWVRDHLEPEAPAAGVVLDALRLFEVPRHLDVVASKLKSMDPWIRIAALDVLGVYCEEGGVQAMKALGKTESDPLVRWNLGRVYERCVNAEARSRLLPVDAGFGKRLVRPVVGTIPVALREPIP